MSSLLFFVIDSCVVPTFVVTRDQVWSPQGCPRWDPKRTQSIGLHRYHWTLTLQLQRQHEWRQYSVFLAQWGPDSTGNACLSLVHLHPCSQPLDWSNPFHWNFRWDASWYCWTVDAPCSAYRTWPSAGLAFLSCAPPMSHPSYCIPKMPYRWA